MGWLARSGAPLVTRASQAPQRTGTAAIAYTWL